MLTRFAAATSDELHLCIAATSALQSFFLFVSISLPSRKSHPEYKEQLGELRRHLLESAGEMAPLKVWEMQGRNTLIPTVTINVKLYCQCF